MRDIQVLIFSKSIYIIFLVFTLSANCFGQIIEISDSLKKQIGIQKSSSDAYNKALKIATKFYDKAEYHKASKAYQAAFLLEEEHVTYARYRLYAAAANCMIDNEKGVKENLFAMVPLSTKKDMVRILVSYQIFNKYKQTEWWKELETNLDERLKNLIAHHKNLKIFKKGRNLVYKAIRINVKGDTLANTFVTMKPDGTGWLNEANVSQSQVIYEYQYTLQDSINHINELEEIVTTKFWIKSDTTGIIENENRVWIHPIRNNEFFKTEVAPFPVVIFPISAETMKNHKPKIWIINKWGTYSNSLTESEYTYLGESIRTYPEIGEIKCFQFKAESFNNFHGISRIEYYFNEDLGFVEMKYHTYDDDEIFFILDEIITE